MTRFDPDRDLAGEFADNWNRKLRGVRVTGIIVGILMLIIGILCFIFPVRSAQVLEFIASLMVIVCGVFDVVCFCTTAPFLRMGGELVGGILNIIVGVMLIASPAEVSLSAYSFIFALMLLVFGVNEISFAMKLGYFAVSGFGWVIADAVLNILAGLAFFIMPVSSAFVMSWLIGIYLIVGGASVLIGSICTTDMRV